MNGLSAVILDEEAIDKAGDEQSDLVEDLEGNS